MRNKRTRSLVAGAILAVLLSSLAVTLVTQLWTLPMHVPFQYTHSPTDDQQDATLDLMLIKNIHETGWFDTNPKLNAPFEQHWAEWPMGGDLLAYTIKKGIVDTTNDVPLTFNLFWLLTFPLTALVAFPVLRALRCSWATALAGAVLFSLAPYHFRNGAGHENLAFYVGVPVIVLLCMKVLGPDSGLPSLHELRRPASWWRMRWYLLGAVLIGVTGIYYLAFLLALLGVSAVVSALARRRPGRLVTAALFGGVGLVTAIVANLPTLLYRWQHSPNILGVPDRAPGVSEAYPLRLVELLSPVTAHRFGVFAAIADHLYEPGREGLGTAELGLAAAIGFVIAVTTVLVRAVRNGDRRGWSFEARLGLIMVAALLIGMKGGLSRALEYTGLQGVRAWNRIAIVIGFAAIVVLARLLDRVRVRIYRRHWRRPRMVLASLLVIVVAVGVLDQTAPAMMPNPSSVAALWHADGAFVASMERQLPKDAMVFQLPVVDFPEHGAVQQLSAHDLIKEGYLHSKTLRWSAGGVRGRDGEWQWPASLLPMRQLLRGVIAIGFSALTLDRYGFPDDGTARVATVGAPPRPADRHARRPVVRVGSPPRDPRAPRRHECRGAPRAGAADARRTADLPLVRRRSERRPRRRPRHLFRRFDLVREPRDAFGPQRPRARIAPTRVGRAPRLRDDRRPPDPHQERMAGEPDTDHARSGNHEGEHERPHARRALRVDARQRTAVGERELPRVVTSTGAVR